MVVLITPGVTDARICAKLYKNLLQHFDWIGTTKRPSRATMKRCLCFTIYSSRGGHLTMMMMLHGTLQATI
jgi:hypothetical protein